MYMGSNRSITTTASTLTANDYPVRYGIRIKADHSNGGIVYIGNSSSVTAGSAPGTDGWPLGIDQEVYFPGALMSSTGSIYVIGSAGTQVLYWFLDLPTDPSSIGGDMSDPYTSELVPVIF